MPLRALVTGFLCVAPTIVAAEIPQPIRSTSEFLHADNIILCSDFEALNKARITRFLAGVPGISASVSIIDGPETLPQPEKFNVLVVVAGQEAADATVECATKSVPYDEPVASEISTSLARLGKRPSHPNPKIEEVLEVLQWGSSLHYHRRQNWITIVIGMLQPSPTNLNSTMIRLFDFPKHACERNSGCFNVD